MKQIAALKSLPHQEAYRLAWPMILSNLSIPLFGLADTAMLGHLDESVYLGAAAVGTNILAFVYWIFAFLRMGTTSIIGRALGAKDHSSIIDQLFSYLIVAMFIALSLILSQNIILPFGVALVAPAGGLSDLALEYCQIRIFGAPAVLLTFVLIGWFIGLQNTRFPLAIVLTSNLVNIGLDYLFIVIFDWKTAGAAYATLLAEYLGLAIAIALAARQMGLLALPSPHWPSIFNIRKWKAIFVYNSDLFLRTCALLFAFNFFTAQGAAQGTDILAANAALMQIGLFIAFGLDGYAHAAEAMVSKALGAKNPQAFFDACKATTFWAFVIACGFTLFFILFKHPLVHLLTDIEQVRPIVNQYYIWVCLLPLVSVWCYMLDGIFIGSGKTTLLRNWMLLAVFGIYIPFSWIFRGYGNHGLWASFILFNLFRSASLAAVYWQQTFRNNW